MSRKKLDTKTRILRAAYIEFQNKGYKLADINAIVKKAGVTKGGMYYYFKSKKELAECVIKTELADRVNNKFLNKFILDENVSFQEILLDSLSDINTGEVESGSILIKFANEMPLPKDSTMSPLYDVVECMKSKIAERLKFDRDRNRLRKDIDPEAMAQMVLTVILGSFTFCKLNRDPDILMVMMKQLNLLLDNIYVKVGVA